MSRILVYSAVLLFAIIAQCADIGPKKLIFIDGGSNFGKTTTSAALEKHFKDKNKKVARISIDYHWTLLVWGGYLFDAAEFIAENDSWNDLELKFNQYEGNEVLLKKYFKYAKDFFTKIHKANPYEALKYTRNYDVKQKILDKVLLECCMGIDVVIVDISLNIVLRNIDKRSDWDRVIGDISSHNIIHIILVSDYKSYLERYEHRNNSATLSEHRSNKLSENDFNDSIIDAQQNYIGTRYKNNKIIIDISDKCANDIVDEVVSFAGNFKYYW